MLYEHVIRLVTACIGLVSAWLSWRAACAKLPAPKKASPRLAFKKCLA